MLALLAMLAQDYVLRDLKTSPVADYGAFRLERDDCIAHPDVAVLHDAPCIARLRLTWSSADRSVSVVYEDNGALLTRSYRFPVRLNPTTACPLGGAPTAYAARPGNAADWQAATKPFAATLARCSAVAPPQIRAYAAEFAAAAADYEPAAAGLRAAASARFRSLRRCARLKTTPLHGGHDETVTCVRWEG